MRISMKNSTGRRTLAIACVLACLLSSAALPARAAQQEIPGFCKPVLEAWGAANEEELMDALLEWRKENLPQGWQSLTKGLKTPVTFRLGGSTEELIQTHREWDVAIVSSREADLQALAEAGLISCATGCATPVAFYALEQWAYPEAVKQKLPKDPLYYYCVYCYSYDPDTDEAVFVLWNTKDRPSRWGGHAARQLLERRTPDEVRAVEGLCRKIDWKKFGMPELSSTEEELIAHPEEWDWAFLRIDTDYRLDKLNAAGLLYDFSKEEYWASRSPEWQWGGGIYNEAGQLIAIPYHHWSYDGYDTISVFVVNAKSSVIPRALEYGEHYIKSFEWNEYGRHTHSSDPEVIRKLHNASFEDGGGAILKEDVDW